MFGVFVDDESNGGLFLLDLMLECWVWILRALEQFKGSARSPGLLQDFEDGYIKL